MHRELEAPGDTRQSIEIDETQERYSGADCPVLPLEAEELVGVAMARITVLTRMRVSRRVDASTSVPTGTNAAPTAGPRSAAFRRMSTDYSFAMT